MHRNTACFARYFGAFFFKGTTEQINCGWMPNLLPHPSRVKSGKYIQYSATFNPFGWNKILRHQLLPIYSEVP